MSTLKFVSLDVLTLNPVDVSSKFTAKKLKAKHPFEHINSTLNRLVLKYNWFGIKLSNLLSSLYIQRKIEKMYYLLWKQRRELDNDFIDYHPFRLF